ncbi:MAG: hypothetical protein SWO11_05395 [Thermodesulfobacteriota bacterium]|nr:hypothetical protein [Thermodesulfobacteriota bacterium]
MFLSGTHTASRKFGGIGVFAGKGIRKISLSISICQILLVKLINRFNLTSHHGMKGFREESGAVLTALGGSKVDKLAFKIADAQADTFH